MTREWDLQALSFLEEFVATTMELLALLEGEAVYLLGEETQNAIEEVRALVAEHVQVVD